MKEPYGEGVASHTDPESCVVSREAGYEVLIRGTCREGIEPRNAWESGCRPCLFMGKATLVDATSRAPTGPARSKTPDMHGTSTCENREALPVSDLKLFATHAMIGSDQPLRRITNRAVRQWHYRLRAFP